MDDFHFARYSSGFEESRVGIHEISQKIVSRFSSNLSLQNNIYVPGNRMKRKKRKSTKAFKAKDFLNDEVI